MGNFFVRQESGFFKSGIAILYTTLVNEDNVFSGNKIPDTDHRNANHFRKPVIKMTLTDHDEHSNLMDTQADPTGGEKASIFIRQSIFSRDEYPLPADGVIEGIGTKK
jgi:hypothetical protein